MVKNTPNGFTLIELIIVIVILGILAVVVTPRFIDVGTNARVAKVESLKSAVIAANKLAFMKCQVTAGCSRSIRLSAAFEGPNSVTGTLYYGYPTGRSRVPVYFSINDWMEISDEITYTEVSSQVGTFTFNNAPDPDNCSVRFREATVTEDPIITSIVSGC